MRLAGEDELNGFIRVVEDGGEAFGVVEDERAALIGCEATCEAEGEGGIAQDCARGDAFVNGRVAAG
jgi:hypothetical protein